MISLSAASIVALLALALLPSSTLAQNRGIYFERANLAIPSLNNVIENANTQLKGAQQGLHKLQNELDDLRMLALNAKKEKMKLGPRKSDVVDNAALKLVSKDLDFDARGWSFGERDNGVEQATALTNQGQALATTILGLSRQVRDKELQIKATQENMESFVQNAKASLEQRDAFEEELASSPKDASTPRK
ncbi:hypothetical protein TrLO_g44 [Triparma laevis f. longispina]|uniref:Uncharacterized protein n=1 Tax=Triparma laevis f. longispina TaxID=1714387 RepID=A0A9W7F4X8_9STRA|nr:hypothetical protein TrLO_g44 [Triparma laevis f. longispina]